MAIPYNPAIPLLGIYPEKTTIRKDICAPMFIAALFRIARTCKQPKCPSIDKWIKNKCYIYTMKYYSVIKRWSNAIWSNMDRFRDFHTSKSDVKRQVPYDIAYVWNLKNKEYKWIYLQNRNRVTIEENKIMVTRECGKGINWEIGIGIYILLCINR